MEILRCDAVACNFHFKKPGFPIQHKSAGSTSSSPSQTIGSQAQGAETPKVPIDSSRNAGRSYELPRRFLCSLSVRDDARFIRGRLQGQEPLDEVAIRDFVPVRNANAKSGYQGWKKP